MNDCIFCQIAQKAAPAHIIWEDDFHMAFLSIFPNTAGFSVVITKEHYPSYAFENSDEILSNLLFAAKKVALLLDKAFPDVARTGLILEGFGVDHLHAKLFPMHGTTDSDWRENINPSKQYFEKYEGYISSSDSVRADDANLADLARKINFSSETVK